MACVSIVVVGAVVFARKHYLIGFWLSALSAVMWAVLGYHAQLYGMMALEIFLVATSLYGAYNVVRKRG